MLFKAYRVNPVHRGALPKARKSQWTISEWHELRLFTLAECKGWVSSKKQELWSIYIQGGKRIKIGEDLDGDLYIAKYVTDANNEWHGYPVAPRQYDIPPNEVVSSWHENGLIDKTDKSRIIGGKF